MDWVYVAVGLAILLFAGDILVKGAIALSLRLGIPTLIVSLTVVAFGTSAPELLIAIKAVLNGTSGLALGNVVGSNTANVLLVLGIPALICVIKTGECASGRSYIQMLAATALFVVAFFLGVITPLMGAGLLIALGVMMFIAAKGPQSPCDEDEFEDVDPMTPWFKVIVFVLIGIVGLPLGASLLVDGATSIARNFGVSDTVIGLTLVAVGTSLPELATTVMASLRKQADVAIGNVIGSNMFNLLGIIGVASIFGNIEVDAQIMDFDIWVMGLSTLVLIPFVFLKWNLTRLWGGVFTGLYLVYVCMVLI